MRKFSLFNDVLGPMGLGYMITDILFKLFGGK